MKLLTNKEMADFDKYTIEKKKIPSLILMENAAYSIYENIKKIIDRDSNILILTGKGNNGGDGFALSRILKNKNYKPEIFQAYSSKSEDAIKNKEIAEKYKIKFINELSDIQNKYDLIVDAVFGTGFKGQFEVKIKNLFKKINELEAYKVAIDIPSGINGTTASAVENTFNADLVITFEYPLIGHFIYPAKKFIKKLKVESIGILRPQNYKIKKEVITKDNLFLNHLKHDVHKYSRGTVFFIGGKTKFSGASALCCNSALKSGAGYVKLIDIEGIDRSKLNDEIVVETNFDFDVKINDKFIKNGVVTVGPGFGRSENKLKILKNIFSNFEGLRLVIDADALYHFNEYYKKDIHEVVITPHIGEFSRIVNKDIKDIKKNIFEIGKNFAAKNRCTLVLKSENTVVFSKDGEIALNQFGNPYMATLGTGDVLTGMISAIWATNREKNPFKMTKKAVGLHSVAADYLYENKYKNYTATDLVNNLNVIIEKYIK